MEAVDHLTSGTGGADYQRLELLGGGEYLHSEMIKVILSIDHFQPTLIVPFVLRYLFEKYLCWSEQAYTHRTPRL